MEEVGSSGMNIGPVNRTTKRTIDWKIPVAKMCLVIFLEIIYSVFLYGGLRSNSGLGSSVARASEASESIMRFTHKSWMV